MHSEMGPQLFELPLQENISGAVAVQPQEGVPMDISIAQLIETPPEIAASYRRGWGKGKKFAAGATMLVGSFLGGAGYYADSHPVQTSQFLRSTIGNEKTVELEGWVFHAKDIKNRWKYKLFGGRENPYGDTFTQVTNPAIPVELTPDIDMSISSNSLTFEPPSIIFPEIQQPKPLELPQTHLIQSNPQTGEGIWAIDGLPHTSAEDVLMAKTYIRPDKDRPDSSVAVLLLDERRIKLNMVGGTEQPGKGPGKIAEKDLSNLIVAFSGGFQNPDGNYGMRAQGAEYLPLRNGVATAVVMKDGTIKIGSWGEGELAAWTDDMEAARQNCKLLVKNGKVTPEAENKESNNDDWGYIDKKSSAFITWRSAMGLTKNGDLLVAVGNSLSAKTLAYALQAAGAEIAMQLEINSPHATVLTYNKKEDGTLIPSYLRDKMDDRDLNRFFKPQTRDFMYITLDETNFKPTLANR